MQVKIEILPWLSSSLRPGTVGTIRFEHRLSGTTFRDLLEGLAEVEPGFDRLIYDRENRELRYPARAIVNEQLLEFLGGMNTALHDGDTVAFMAAYTGG